MREEVLSIVLDVAEKLNPILKKPLPLSQGEQCKLYGGEGLLDSMALVSLVVGIEEEIEDRFDVSIIIVSDKAMSRRHSPFLNVASLSNYVVQLVQEQRV